MRTLDGLVLTFLVNALWQVLLVVGAAALGDRFLHRGPARYRHALWLAALALCLLLPAASLLPRGDGAKATDEAPAAAKPGEGGPAGWLGFRGEHRPAPLTVPAAPAVALLYGFSVTFAAVRLGRTWRRTRRLGRRAVPLVVPEEAAALVVRCQATLGTGPVTLFTSTEVAGPVTLGRAIVLPPGFLASSSPDELAAALGHELAHVRRRDYAVNLASEILLLPLVFHPAVRLIRRRLALTREMAADEAAAGSLIGARTYARSLLAIASSMAGVSQPSFTLGVSDTQTLEVRMRQPEPDGAGMGGRAHRVRQGGAPRSAQSLLGGRETERGRRAAASSVAPARAPALTLHRAGRSPEARRNLQGEPSRRGLLRPSPVGFHAEDRELTVRFPPRQQPQHVEQAVLG